MSREKWFQEEIDEMIKEVVAADTQEKVIEIFDVALTPREINDMARRIKVLKYLKEGKSYSEIQQLLQVSTGLISKISVHIGFGFRRSSTSTHNAPIHKPKKKRTVITYKGAVPIHKIFS